MTLEGVRILDLSRLLPAPYATRVLAELGAEVIKIESPDGGDYTRWSPPLVGDPPVSGLFREVNRGKKSVTLDLKKAEDAAKLRELVAISDVLVDSFRPGVLARLGLDPRALMEQHPRLIYCAVTGFGLTGPDAQRAGHDIGYNARSGALAVTGSEDTPVAMGVQIADIGGGLAAVAGILGALYERERTGRGKVVDIALAEASLAFNTLNFGSLHAGGEVRRGREVLDGSRPCYAIYRAADGHLAVGALEPKFWASFLSVINLPHLMDAQLDLGEPGARAKAEVQAVLQTKTIAEWLPLFRQADCCVEPILALSEVESDPHHQARHTTDAAGMVRSPIRIETWSTLTHPKPPLREAPALGEHTQEVLASLPKKNH